MPKTISQLTNAQTAETIEKTAQFAVEQNELSANMTLEELLGAKYADYVVASSDTIDWTEGAQQLYSTTSPTKTLSFTAPARPEIHMLVLHVLNMSTTGLAITWPATVKWGRHWREPSQVRTDITTYVFHYSNTLASYICIGTSTSTAVDGSVDVRDYGAVGNGTTDDTAAIQAAINTGKNVYFPHGRYLVSDTLEVTDNYQSLFADGQSGRILCSITDGTSCIKVNGADHVSIRGIRIIENGGAAIKNFIGIEFTGSLSWHLDNTYVMYAATAYKFTNSWSGTGVNVWANYTTLGLSATNLNNVRLDMHIENAAQAFAISGAEGTTMKLLTQGTSRTSASTLDNADSFTIEKWYLENNASDPSSTPELTIGGSTICHDVSISLQAAYNTSITCEVIALDDVDGVSISGNISKAAYRDYVTTTSSTKNLSLNLIDSGTTAKQTTVPASVSLITPVNFHPDPYFWSAIPSTTGASNAIASEETTIVCPWTTRSLKVTQNGGNYNVVAHQFDFSTYADMAVMKGLLIGAATWIYVPDSGFYTMNAAGPEFILGSNGTGAANSSQSANGGTSNSVLWKIGDWALIVVQCTVPADATYVKLWYYANNTATAATANTYCYFGSTLIWIGGKSLTRKIQNGLLSHHSSVWS